MKTITTETEAQEYTTERTLLSIPDIGCSLFEVNNLGHIAVNGWGIVGPLGTVGVSMGCSWGQYGWSSGVMEFAEVREFRDHLTALLEENGHE